MRPQNLAQRCMQKVSRRVVAGRVLASGRVDVCVDRVAHRHRALRDLAEVNCHVWHHSLGVVHLYLAVGADNLASVADLSATLRVEGRIQQHDFDILALGNLIHSLVAGDQADDRG